MPPHDLVEHQRLAADDPTDPLDPLDTADAVDQDDVGVGGGQGLRPLDDVGFLRRVGTGDDHEVLARGQDHAELLQVLRQRQHLLAVGVPAPPGALLVLQDDAGGTGALEALHDVAGHFRIDVAVVDVDEEVMAGKAPRSRWTKPIMSGQAMNPMSGSP